jgi:hypothetical protein
MRSLALLAFLSANSLAAELRLQPLPPKETKKKKSFVEKFFQTIDGGDMNGFPGPDWSRRKPENPLGTMTVRWVLHF